MPIRVHIDKPVPGREDLVVGQHKLLNDGYADMLIRENYGHVAGSAEDAEKKAADEAKAAEKRTAEKDAKALDELKNGPKQPEGETAKQRKAREKAERKAAKKAADAAKAAGAGE